MSDTTGATGASPRLTAVAQTAMLVAAARLAEARRKNPVLTDELLEAMIGSSAEVIAAVRQCVQETQQQERGGPCFHHTCKHREYPVTLRRSVCHADDGVDHVASFTSVRMKFGDCQLQHFRASHDTFQIVILGAGLDTRPWRLDLGSGVSVYDIDQPDMTNFKKDRLSAVDAQLQMDKKNHRFPLRIGGWKGVPLDLTGPWLPGLLQSGLSTGAGLGPPPDWCTPGCLRRHSAADHLQDTLLPKASLCCRPLAVQLIAYATVVMI